MKPQLNLEDSAHKNHRELFVQSSVQFSSVQSGELSVGAE